MRTTKVLKFRCVTNKLRCANDHTLRINASPWLAAAFGFVVALGCGEGSDSNMTAAPAPQEDVDGGQDTALEMDMAPEEDTVPEEDVAEEDTPPDLNDAMRDVEVEPDSSADVGPDVPGETAAQTFLDLEYLRVAGTELAMDLRVPEGPGPFPLVVVVHGGAFKVGDKATGNAAAWAEFLPTVGIASSTVNYRLTPDYPNETEVFPGPLQDVKCAIRWLRSRAQEYRLDSRVVVLGGSAGGYFSNAISVTGDTNIFEGECPGTVSEDSSVMGGVSFYGISDWTTINRQRGPDAEPLESEARFVNAPCLDDPREDACVLASPRTHISSDDPPMFLLHSDDDAAIPVMQSRQFRDMLGEAGVDVTYLEVEGKGHGWSGRFADPDVAVARDQVVDWLNALFER